MSESPVCQILVLIWQVPLLSPAMKRRERREISFRFIVARWLMTPQCINSSFACGACLLTIFKLLRMRCFVVCVCSRPPPFWHVVEHSHVWSSFTSLGNHHTTPLSNQPQKSQLLQRYFSRKEFFQILNVICGAAKSSSAPIFPEWLHKSRTEIPHVCGCASLDR